MKTMRNVMLVVFAMAVCSVLAQDKGKKIKPEVLEIQKFVGLSSDKTQQVNAIYMKSTVDWNALRASDATDAEKAEQGKKLTAEKTNAMRELLTEEEFKKWKDYKREKFQSKKKK